MHAVEVWTLAAVVGAGILFSILERRYPYNRGQHLIRAGFWNDLLLYGFVQSYVLGVVIGRLILWMDGRTGLSRLHLLSGWPVAAQIALFVVTHDLYIYLFHRLQHASPLLWRLHEAHHATENVDWISGSRSHALEILINQSIEFVPIALLGAAPQVALIKVTIDALWGMYIHCNVDVHSGRLQKIVNGPEMHRWHHAIEITDGVNFATKFACWDWLFGTAHLPPVKPRGYGILEPFPAGYLRQQLHLFSRRPAAPAGDLSSA